MSKVFSFTPDYDYPINADEVERGGSGYCISLVNGKEVFDKAKDKPLPPEIEHIYPDYDLYPELTKDTAYGFLTRGCPRSQGIMIKRVQPSEKDGYIKCVSDNERYAPFDVPTEDIVQIALVNGAITLD